MEYKILYYVGCVGEGIGLNTNYSKGVLLLQKDHVYLVDKNYNKKEIEVREVKLLCISRLATVIKVGTKEGNVFISVYRAVVGSSFGIINRGKTEELYCKLKNYVVRLKCNMG